MVVIVEMTIEAQLDRRIASSGGGFEEAGETEFLHFSKRAF